MQTLKKVSVVMCTYNGEKYLKEQLDSLVSQTYPIYEIRIQDDCSTDNTMSVLKEYETRYPIIKVSRNATNIGHKLNFKTAFYKAEGDYIAIADQDDIWVDTKIEQLVNAIGENYLVYSASLAFIGEKEPEYVPAEAPARHPFTFVTLQDGVYGHSALFNRELLHFIPAEAWSRYPYDYTLCWAAMGLNKITGLNRYLTYWRRHPAASSGMPGTSKKRLAGYINGIRSFWNRENRKKVERFYRSVLPFFKEESLYKEVVSVMTGPGRFRMVRMSKLTYRYRHQLVSDTPPDSLLGRFRALYAPFFIYRNYQQVQDHLVVL